VTAAPVCPAAGGGDVPAGYSDLDELLAQSGGLTASNAPIFMPSDVLFGYDESFLRPGAVISLEKLGELIRRSPQSRFRIEGNTDSFGGPDYNARLSLARADSVKTWLAQTMGIEPSRIDTRGLGSTKPLAPVDGTIEQQQLNRRVDIVILRADGGR
ncbi:MAG: OmpA family protein, partial [Chthoniobacterales bacterium]